MPAYETISGATSLSQHLVMLGVGRIGVLGDDARRFPGKARVAFRAAGRKPGRRARAQPLDRGANDDVWQQHPLGGADDRGNQAHAATPRRGGIGKNRLVRD